MESYVAQSLYSVQKDVYSELNRWAEKGHYWKFSARVLSVPFAFLEISSNIAILPIAVIEHIARAALNLLGAAFIESYALKNVVKHINDAAVILLFDWISVIAYPIFVIIQSFNGINNPKEHKCMLEWLVGKSRAIPI